MQYRLSTLMILLAAGPPTLAVMWWLWPLFTRREWFGIEPWELMMVGMVIFILFGHHLPRLMRALFRDYYL